MNLPPGYRLDEVTDPDVVILRQEDGSVVAVFTLGTDREEIERVAWEDHWQRRSHQGLFSGLTPHWRSPLLGDATLSETWQLAEPGVFDEKEEA